MGDARQFANRRFAVECSHHYQADRDQENRMVALDEHFHHPGAHGINSGTTARRRRLQGTGYGLHGESGVNFLDQRSRITNQKRRTSNDLIIAHYSLAIERSAGAHGNTRIVTDATGKLVEDTNYDGFGNALGFNAATELPTYLYNSMPFDAASGNYYDHARYFDTGTGSFTQSDYGYTGSLANPMADLAYAFTGNDPINMSDLNGHGFSLPDVIVSMGVTSTLGGLSIGGFSAAG
jgi:RHS repeat-associated protein